MDPNSSEDDNDSLPPVAIVTGPDEVEVEEVEMVEPILNGLDDGDDERRRALQARTRVDEKRLVFVWEFCLKSTQKDLSDKFVDSRGCSWRIMFFPTGNKPTYNNPNPEHASIFLELQDFGPQPKVRQRKVRFSFAALNRRDIRESKVQNLLEFTFKDGAMDWGYPHHFSRADLLENSPDFADAHGNVMFSVYVDDVDDPATPHNSKAATGMVGLKNQGATCYMNSLLQTLYHLRKLRKAVYDTPTEREDTVSGVALAMQRVFYRLQSSDRAVATKELTKSFGWDNYETFTQQDVQELNRVLCDRLEDRMKGTPVDGTIKELFEGRIRSFIRCVDVEYASEREETFYDVQLDVKGCADIDASFEKYVAEELLDGEDKYDAGEEHGKQTAKKGVRFLAFPPVLTIHLKRFEYDMHTGNLTKVNDRYEFPFKLELDKYLAEDVVRDPLRPDIFVLHSVLVHSGDVNGGHYYAYIRTSEGAEGGQWCKFDDENVFNVEAEEAIRGSYGCNRGDPSSLAAADSLNYWGAWNKGPAANFFTSAYMLVYVRVCDLPSVMLRLDGLPHGGMPEALVERFREEEAQAAIRVREKQESHMYSTIAVATEDDVSAFEFEEGIVTAADREKRDFINWDTPRSVRVLKTGTGVDLVEAVCREFKVEPEEIRLFLCIQRENGTIRIDTPLQAPEVLQSLDDLFYNSAVTGSVRGEKQPRRSYLQRVPKPATAVISAFPAQAAMKAAGTCGVRVTPSKPGTAAAGPGAVAAAGAAVGAAAAAGTPRVQGKDGQASGAAAECPSLEPPAAPAATLQPPQPDAEERVSVKRDGTREAGATGCAAGGAGEGAIEGDAEGEAASAAAAVAEAANSDSVKAETADDDNAAAAAAVVPAGLEEGGDATGEARSVVARMPTMPAGEVLLFIRSYIPPKGPDGRGTVTEAEMTYCGSLEIALDLPASVLASRAAELAGCPGATVVLYEIVTNVNVNKIDLRQTLAEGELQHGDIICLQQLPQPTEEPERLPAPDAAMDADDDDDEDEDDAGGWNVGAMSQHMRRRRLHRRHRRGRELGMSEWTPVEGVYRLQKDLSTADKYCFFKSSHMLVHFVPLGLREKDYLPKGSYTAETESPGPRPGMTVEMGVKTVCLATAEALVSLFQCRVDPRRVRLLPTTPTGNPYMGREKPAFPPIDARDNQLARFLRKGSSDSLIGSYDTLFFEVLPFTREEMHGHILIDLFTVDKNLMSLRLDLEAEEGNPTARRLRRRLQKQLGAPRSADESSRRRGRRGDAMDVDDSSSSAGGTTAARGAAGRRHRAEGKRSGGGSDDDGGATDEDGDESSGSDVGGAGGTGNGGDGGSGGGGGRRRGKKRARSPALSGGDSGVGVMFELSKELGPLHVLVDSAASAEAILAAARQRLRLPDGTVLRVMQVSLGEVIKILKPAHGDEYVHDWWPYHHSYERFIDNSYDVRAGAAPDLTPMPYFMLEMPVGLEADVERRPHMIGRDGDVVSMPLQIVSFSMPPAAPKPGPGVRITAPPFTQFHSAPLLMSVHAGEELTDVLRRMTARRGEPVGGVPLERCRLALLHKQYFRYLDGEHWGGYNAAASAAAAGDDDESGGGEAAAAGAGGDAGGERAGSGDENGENDNAGGIAQGGSVNGQATHPHPPPLSPPPSASAASANRPGRDGDPRHMNGNASLNGEGRSVPQAPPIIGDTPRNMYSRFYRELESHWPLFSRQTVGLQGGIEVRIGPSEINGQLPTLGLERDPPADERRERRFDGGIKIRGS